MGLVGLLARVVQRITTTSGDHRTALPELTLHRRNRPNQPVHSIYSLGMAPTVQGSKQVLLGEKDLSPGPIQGSLASGNRTRDGVRRAGNTITGNS